MIKFCFKNDPLIIDMINEAKTKALDLLEKEFGHDRVFSTLLVENFSRSLFKRIFRVLNAAIFGNKLKPIATIECTQEEIHMIAKKSSGSNYDSSLKYYAAYFPEFYSNGTLKKDSMFMITDNGAMTFMFIVSSICHELIHQYDVHCGDMKQIMLSHRYSRGVEHRTPTFVHFSTIAKTQGINVMVSGKNIPFDILNKQMVQFTTDLQENEDESYDDNWADYYKKRILAGDTKGIENMCIMPDGCIGLFLT